MRPRLSTRSRHRFLLWSLGLGLALLAVSCAPAAPTESAPPAETEPAAEQPAATEAVAEPAETEAPAAQTEAPVAELPPFVPHGDQLVATDPTTVSLASGGLQLVEFFRFT